MGGKGSLKSKSIFNKWREKAGSIFDPAFFVCFLP
jgi:hypothetical protein